jgi:hypothetical protein
MAEQAQNPGVRQHGIVRAIALVCAFMVLFAATLRVAHTHSAAEQESGHCQICMAIHTAMPAAAAPVHIILHAAPETVVAPTPEVPAKARVATLSDRAPPTLA